MIFCIHLFEKNHGILLMNGNVIERDPDKMFRCSILIRK
jgi:hypothetical protein